MIIIYPFSKISFFAHAPCTFRIIYILTHRFIDVNQLHIQVNQCVRENLAILMLIGLFV